MSKSAEFGYRTQIVRIDASAPDRSILEDAAQRLLHGEIVAFPTETVYGLGADATNAKAVEKIFLAKNRPATNPLIVHVGSKEMAQKWVRVWPDTAEQLARRFWPGPLTFVLPKNADIPAIVSAGRPTVGIRCPAHPVALALIEATDRPLAAPSANLSNAVSPTRAEHVAASLLGRIPLILDAGPTECGIESTVLDLTTHPPQLLRPGGLCVRELEQIIGPIQRSQTVPPSAQASMSSPGQFARHYAPSTPVECAHDWEELIRKARLEKMAGRKVAGLLYETAIPSDLSKIDLDQWAILPGNPKQYASRLYEILHQFDEKKFDRILILEPPDTEEWLGIRDRIRRASTPP